MLKKPPKKALINFINFTITFSLIFWLVKSKQLDFLVLGTYWENPTILFSMVFFWCFGAVFLCAMRWRYLLLGLDLKLSKKNAIKLNLIGVFFNTIMPGAVGGDLIKALYVCKGQESSTKVPVVLTILLDRILGLVSLLLISLIAILLNWSLVFNTPALKSIVFIIICIMLGLSGFGLFVMIPSSYKKKILPFMILKKILFKWSLSKNMYLALRSYKNQKIYILKALLSSLGHQFIYTLVFVQVTNILNSSPTHYGLLATILPLGILTTAIPISPGGLGLGHVAFENLFQLIGLKNGANVFNIIFFGNLFLNLLGSIPYLFLKKELDPLISENQKKVTNNLNSQELVTGQL